MRLFPGLLKGASGRLGVQAVRYLISGTAAFLVDTGLLTLLTECFGERLLLLWTAVAFGAGLVTTYLFSIHWVFNSRNVSDRRLEFGIFALIGIVGLGLTELLMWLFTGKAGLHYLLSKGITTVIVFVWNFCAKKLLLFRNK